MRYTKEEAAPFLGVEPTLVARLVEATGISEHWEKNRRIGERTLRILYRKLRQEATPMPPIPTRCV